VWYTIWGESPQILGGGEVNDLQQAQQIFQSDTWEQMLDDLGPLTENFKIRVVHGRAGEHAE
jgi:hypothetical protein